MARITVTKPYSMSRDAIREAAEDLARGLQRDHGLRYRWQGDTATFSRSGVKGTLDISDDAITLSVELGLLASPFAKPIRQAVVDYLDEHVT